MAHTFFKLGLTEAVTTHCDEFIGPVLLQFADFARGHNDGACEC